MGSKRIRKSLPVIRPRIANRSANRHVDKIKVGMIGFGLSGKVFHAPLLKAHESYDVQMVSSSRATEINSIFPHAEVVNDAQIVIKNKDLDLIVNCAPNNFHFSFSAAALECGKHVVVEKPFVNTVEEGQTLIELARRNKKVVTAFHNRRWDADFLTVRKLIEVGTLGKIKQFESHMDRWRPTLRAERWREQAIEGSGLFYDLGSHLIDQTLTLFGMPDRLIADVQIQKENGVTDDYFHVVLHYGEMRAILHSSSFAPTTPRFQIFGDQGSFIKHGTDPQEEQLKQGLSPNDRSFGVDANDGISTNHLSNQSQKIVSEKGRYLTFYDELYACLASENGKPPVEPTDALRTIQIIELARESSRLGAVVALKF
jgi:scyllo-inositol 2-dehydrogenase (NADP+)